MGAADHEPSPATDCSINDLAQTDKAALPRKHAASGGGHIMSLALTKSRQEPATGVLQRLFDTAVPMALTLTDASADLAIASRSLVEQTKILHLVEASAEQMAGTSAAVAGRLASISETANSAGAQVAEAARVTLSTISQAQACASGLAVTANEIDVQAMAADTQVNDLKRSSDGIQKIAREIQMLAVNAGVEAARHGATGRGFAVIAEAIKGLADQTRLATDQMSKHLTSLGATVASLQGSCRVNVDHAQRMDEAATGAARESARLDGAKQAVSQLVTQIGQTVAPLGQLAAASREIGVSMHAGAAQIERASDGVAASARRFDGVLKVSEELTGIMLEESSGLQIAGLVAMCQTAAQQTGELFATALQTGEIGRDDLFDAQYRLIEGSQPEQYLTRFTGLTDRLLPDLQERVLTADPCIVFCAAVDRNGYLPTHNRKFSQPPSQDPAWNAEHARNRRIFNDRTGLASARNRKPVLLQTYRRDMGDGRFVVINELSSPILVNGQHWGGFRLGFALKGGRHGGLG
jgi:methyl-accepting chemotaxis protein